MSQTQSQTTDDPNRDEQRLDHLERHSSFDRDDLEAMSDAQRLTVLRGTGRPDAALREELTHEWTTVCAVIWRNTDWDTQKAQKKNRADKFAEVARLAVGEPTVPKAIERLCAELGQSSLPEAGEAFARLREEDTLAMAVLEGERITIVSETNMAVARYYDALSAGGEGDADTEAAPSHNPAATDLSQFVGVGSDGGGDGQ